MHPKFLIASLGSGGQETDPLPTSSICHLKYGAPISKKSTGSIVLFPRCLNCFDDIAPGLLSHMEGDSEYQFTSDLGDPQLLSEKLPRAKNQSAMVARPCPGQGGPFSVWFWVGCVQTGKADPNVPCRSWPSTFE
jgi:hypothetical protein